VIFASYPRLLPVEAVGLQGAFANVNPCSLLPTGFGYLHATELLIVLRASDMN